MGKVWSSRPNRPCTFCESNRKSLSSAYPKSFLSFLQDNTVQGQSGNDASVKYTDMFPQERQEVTWLVTNEEKAEENGNRALVEGTMEA